MNRDIAELIAKVAFRSSSDLCELIPLLKSHLSEGEYKAIRDQITKVGASIGYDIIQPIYNEHPDIEAAFDERIEKFGRLF